MNKYMQEQDLVFKRFLLSSPLKKVSAFRVLIFLLLTAFLLSACSISVPTFSSQAVPTNPVVVSSMSGSTQIVVKAGESLGKIPDTAFGVNTAVWDNNLLDGDVPDLLRQAGVKLLRFPGGSTSDVYHWQDNSTTRKQGSTNGQGYVNPNNTFDAFMGLVQNIGAQAFITVNYGTNLAGTDGGDPEEAAAWVQYANVVKHYGIKYWEIGNEVYGNGSYATHWEADQHASKGARYLCAKRLAICAGYEGG
jgi:hypothetical protein